MFNSFVNESSNSDGEMATNISLSYTSLTVGSTVSSPRKQSALDIKSAVSPESAHDVFEKQSLHTEIEDVNALPDSLNVLPSHSAVYDIAKRVLDILAAVVILLALAPLLLIVAVTVIMTSTGPVLFKQPRLGYKGKTFPCYKFRSMVMNAESLLVQSPDLARQYMQQGFKIKDDPRVTTIGKFLRKSSLDELPQLFNVLQGHISMIGPRPIVPKELAMYGKFGEKLLSVKPGLSGMWQASGRSDTTYVERVRLDMTYINQRSLWLDAKLAFLTVWSVIASRGAH